MIIETEKDKETAIERIKEIDLTNGKWEVDIKKKRERRSLDQNALLWLWMTALEKDSETGYTKKEWKEIFQSEFCPRETMRVKGNLIVRIKGTSELNTKEFKQFLDRIQMWCYHEIGVSLPDPDDHRWEAFYEQYKNVG
ncbi:MAG: recombination protein NinB [bacterium]